MNGDNFIKNYLIFRISGRILGTLFLLAILFSFFMARNRQRNNTVTNNNSYNKSNIVYVEEK